MPEDLKQVRAGLMICFVCKKPAKYLDEGEWFCEECLRERLKKRGEEELLK